jgi:hypothetical protein
MYRYSPFMVTSTTDGESRPIYGGPYMVGGYGEGYFFLHMGGYIIYGLDLHLLLRRSTLTHFDMYFVYFHFF